MTLTKDEYLKASSALATGFGPTTDFADPHLGTTVQSEGGIPVAADQLPGQVYSVDQLPNPASAVAYNLPPVTVPAHLILDDAAAGDDLDSVTHVQHKDALDVITGALRKQLGDPALAYDNTIRSQENSLKVFEARTGAGLGNDDEVDDDTVAVDGVIGGKGPAASGSEGATGPIDPEGVQKAPGHGKSVSAEQGTQGKPATTKS